MKLSELVKDSPAVQEFIRIREEKNKVFNTNPAAPINTKIREIEQILKTIESDIDEKIPTGETITNLLAMKQEAQESLSFWKKRSNEEFTAWREECARLQLDDSSLKQNFQYTLESVLEPHIQERVREAKKHLETALNLLNTTYEEIDEAFSNYQLDVKENWKVKQLSMCSQQKLELVQRSGARDLSFFYGNDFEPKIRETNYTGAEVKEIEDRRFGPKIY